MKTEEITFEKLPQAVSYLIKEVAHVRQLLEQLLNQQKNQPSDNKHELLGVNEVCLMIKKAKPTVYTLARNRLIPSYKRGKKLYFYKDEILEWIESSKRKTVEELTMDIEQASQKRHIRR